MAAPAVLPLRVPDLVFVSNHACYQITPKAIVSDACASYSTLDKLNFAVKPLLDDLTTTTDFFSHYRLNLFNKRCPFWNDENGMCGNIACAVETLDDEADIPEVWRSAELGKLEGPVAKHPGPKAKKNTDRPLQHGLGTNVGESCVFEYDDECDERDYCVPEDESASSKGDYVSLLRNPERFTGYAGVGAAQVWDAIYRENCFSRSSFPNSAALGVSQQSSVLNKVGPAAEDLKQILEAAGRQQALEQIRETHPNAPFVAQTGFEAQDECLEKRVFYRVISGMHASISTHLCWDFLNQTTGQWQPNLACYKTRLHEHPDRISNLYFNYALVTRAVAKLGPFIQGEAVPQIFDESLMFKNGEGPSLKEDFRNRFRNVSRVMDCVGCDKCRLWGKLQTAGYGTALKVLFEFDNASEDLPQLKRTEIVALFNTYARISSSLRAIGKFRGMVEEQQALESVSSLSQEDVEPPVGAGAQAKESDVDEDGLEDDDYEEEEEEEEDDGEEEEGGGDDDDEDEAPAKKKGSQCGMKSDKNATVSQSLDDELRLVMRVTKLVLVQWASFPGTLWHILSNETKRFGQFFLGLPVSPRTWKFERPNLDEL
ncbi:endoplasmic oxidoreductin-1 [Verticillium alfalfae VaMs.102]|uniref:Endoplasmic oxidoreductin-1 n=1 Tax=Verticillium alfalfae (strain VaMs.102 / ATCC MYA-4576 / FGSC 10136) TaxID=526221 RepID=C9SR11_VERA1|nr:endoplasmic oxidoreductin-1 [Verticillium alfalfae VaMs.102]EEY21286.1 endoplasmic oxidoreductin-1 [Verticillium alfalfae VaMs.102]